MRRIAVLLLAGLSACGYPEPRLDLYYIRGMSRKEVLRRDPDPIESHKLDRPPRDARADRFLYDIEVETGQRPAFYDLYLRSLSSYGAWGDYVFYDPDGLLLGARRVPLD